MKVLLVNPNQYHHPPVPPIGLEYLHASLTENGYDIHFIDLCFSEDPKQALTSALKNVHPDITSISIRQIDTVLYRSNIFYLDDIREYVSIIHQHNNEVVLGGSGFSIMPASILNYTGADYGIFGPGELALPFLLNSITNKQEPVQIINGYKYYDLKKINHSKRSIISDYKKYYDEGGIAGFRTQTGCYGQCFFCTESCKPIIYFSPEDITKEINDIKSIGINQFHLCDSEFNQDLPHCKAVCNAIIKNCDNIEWSVYMRPYPYDEELFRLMEHSGVNLITLSLDSEYLTSIQYDYISEFFKLSKKYHINTVVDLSVGYPGENKENVKKVIDFMELQPCNSIGVNSYYRVYPGTTLHKMIEQNSELKKCLIDYKENQDYVHPVFFNQINEETLFELIKGKEKFRIEGFEKAVNYQRI